MNGVINGGAVAVEVVMRAISFGSNWRFAMSASKRLGLAILLWATLGTTVRADPIRWQQSAESWLYYLAGQNDGSGGAAPAASSGPATSVTPAMPVLRWGEAAPPPESSVVANAPVSFDQPVSAPAPTPSGPINAFINLGAGPYAQASTITTGNAQPWYSSTQINSFFGGQPTPQQIQSFDNAVLQHVQQTFSSSGVAVSLTTDPNVAAQHTISLVSNTSSASLSDAIGMTQVGKNGFSFIDHIAPSSQSLEQLQWIAAHNISHELMLALGVPEKYDTTGKYIDSKMADWAMMVSPNSTFSPAASQALSQVLASQSNSDTPYQLGAQEVAPVPEPATVALWAVAAVAAFAWRNRARLGLPLQHS
jgi:hypothetical protein